MSAALKPAGAFPVKLRTGFAFRLATLTATIFVASSVMAQDAAPQTAPQVTAPQAAPAVTPPPAVQVTQPVQQPTPALAEPTLPQAPAATPTDTPAVSQTPAQQPSAGEPADGLPATAGQPDFTQPLPEQPVIEPQEAEAPASDQPLDVLTQFFDPEYRSDLPHDLSPWGMFMAADWVVKAVMIGLAFASLVTWTVWLAKSLELAGARARAIRALKIIRSARSLSEAVNAAEGRGGPAARMLRAADEEMQLSEAVIDHAEGDGVKERVTSVLSRIEAYAGRRMSRGTGVLATIGSTAPFVGLFGTVWGIMNSFIGISETQTTNLAVVAPGIAEALLATAIGLVAAIPAVVIYNVFARSVTGYRQLLADAAAGVERLVSRDLDFRKVPPGARAAPMSLVSGG